MVQIYKKDHPFIVGGFRNLILVLKHHSSMRLVRNQFFYVRKKLGLEWARNQILL